MVQGHFAFLGSIFDLDKGNSNEVPAGRDEIAFVETILVALDAEGVPMVMDAAGQAKRLRIRVVDAQLQLVVALPVAGEIFQGNAGILGGVQGHFQ